MKELITTSPFFGIAISVFSYAFGIFLNKKTKLAILNPLLIAYFIIIATLLIFNIPLSSYNKGGDIINMFLSPATAVLAISIYKERERLKKNIAVVLVASLVGSITSLSSVFLLSKAFGVTDEIMYSLLPKGITTPMALAVSSSIGGIEALTMLAVIITGTFGAVFGPILIKVLKLKSEIAQGLSLGTASHAVGTSKALELGDVQGALSSIALTMTGIITVTLSLIIF